MSLVSDKKFDEGQAAFLEADYERALELLESVDETTKSEPDYLKLKGLALQKSGDWRKAGLSLRKALVKNPKDKESWVALGDVMWELKQYRDASESYSEALYIDSEDASLLVARARCNRNRNKLSAALKDALRAAELDKENLAFLSEIAQQSAQAAQREQDKKAMASAVTALQKHSELAGGDVESLQSAAMYARRSEQAELAREILLEALEIEPESADLLNILANALRDMDRLGDAQKRFQQALKIDPDHILANYNFGELLAERSQHNKAEEYYRKTIELKPDYLQAYLGLGRCLAKAERHEEAQEIYDRALELKPNNVRVMLNKAYSYKSMGEMDTAKSMAHKILELEPTEPNALQLYTGVQKLTGDDPMIDKIREVVKNPELGPNARTAISFALAKASDDQKDYPTAFHHYKIANEIRAAGEDPYDPAKVEEMAEKTKELFTADFLESRKEHGLPVETPVFIFGMPRSGTTLTEQIIASHPDAIGTGERREGRQLERMARNKVENFPQDVSPEICRNMAARYLTAVLPHNQRVIRVTDKMPFNFWCVGWLYMMFPKAKFIHTKRSLYDVALSNFFQNFSDNLSFSYNMEDMGHYMTVYHGLVEHWKKVIPGGVYESVYEELVGDSETNIPKLIDYVGLPWDEACLEPHRTKRPIMTASSWQVRQPIYKTSSERWRRYEKQLAPLMRVLGDIK